MLQKWTSGGVQHSIQKDNSTRPYTTAFPSGSCAHKLCESKVLRRYEVQFCGGFRRGTSSNIVTSSLTKSWFPRLDFLTDPEFTTQKIQIFFSVLNVCLSIDQSIEYLNHCKLLILIFETSVPASTLNTLGNFTNLFAFYSRLGALKSFFSASRFLKFER